MENLDEEGLIQAAQQGDLDAFNQLVLTYQGQVYGLAYRLVGDQDTAADMTQETFLAAFRHLNRFRKGSLRAWLMRIAANLCYDVLRKRRARPTSPMSILHTREDSPEILRVGGREQHPEDYAERRELANEIQRALNTLPPEQRLAVVLCDVEEFPYKEAARMIGISLGTLKSRLSRGRARLRAHFIENRELLPASLRSTLRDIKEMPAEQPEDVNGRR